MSLANKFRAPGKSVSSDRLKQIILAFVCALSLLLGGVFPGLPSVETQTQNGEPGHPSESLPVSNWSDPSTWGGTLPDETTPVVIPKDKRVVLDQNARAKNIIVRGTLEVADTGDYALDTGWLLVDGGAFKVGTPERPFKNKFTFTIQDYDPTAQVNCANNGGHYFFKNYFVGAYGGSTMHNAGQTDYCNSNGDADAVGKISIHAADTKREWTQLDGTMEKGATTLSVLDATGWQTGDRIVLASTDYDHRQSEERVITAIDGNDVTLDEPVEYMHFGAITYGVDERGEVANLTRNVTFQTDAQLAETNSQAQTFLDKVTRNLKVKRLNFFVARSGKAYLDGVAIDKAGQEGQLGKYLFHWHHAGDVSGQYVKNSVFSNSLNKCLSVHVSDGATIENNIGYYSAGHCFYLEHDETSEVRSQNNLFKDNLSLETNIPEVKQRVKDYDNLASGFWVTHPNNRFVGNVAGGAGSKDGSYVGSAQRDGGNGFWMEIMSADRTLVPGITQFDGNRAHSNSNTAFWINSPGRYNFADRVEINNFVAYKNRISNMWVRMYSEAEKDFVINDSYFADSLSGVYFASEGKTHIYSLGIVNNSTFVGESENKGTVIEGYDLEVGPDGRTLPLNNPNKSNRGKRTIRGVELYDGHSRYDGNTFVNYQPNTQREAAAFVLTYDTPWTFIPNIKVSNTELINTQPVYYDDSFSNYGARNAHVYDTDGTLSQTSESFYAGAFEFLRDDDCQKIATNSNTHRCVGGNYTMLVLFNQEPYPYDVNSFQYVRRGDGAEDKIFRMATGRNKNIFHGNLTMGEWYDQVGHNPSEPNQVVTNLFDLDFHLRHTLETDDWVGLSYEYPYYPDSVTIDNGNTSELLEYYTREEMEAAESSSYFYDYDEGRLYTKLWVRDNTQNLYPDLAWNTNTALKVRALPTTPQTESLRVAGKTTGAGVYPRYTVCKINDVDYGTAEIEGENARFYVYAPPSDFSGIATVDYRVCHENGTTLYGSVTEEIRVLPANTRPEAISSTLEVLTNSQDNPVELQITDADENFDLSAASTLEVKAPPAHGTIDSSDSTTPTYTPETDFVGQDKVTFLACDNLDGCDLATITFDVGNKAPVAVDDAYTLGENTTQRLNLLANDTDADPGDELQVCAENGYTQPRYGQIQEIREAVGGGTPRTDYFYKPNPGYFGPDSFTYRACDLNGASDEGAVNLTVNETDGIPYANGDEVTLEEDTRVSFNPLENDYSNNGRSLCATDPYGAPTNGTLTRNGNELTYTPNQDFAGGDSFTYRLCDDDGDASEGEVILEILSINDAPVARPDAIDIRANEIAIITPIDNDSDVEGAVLLICEEDALTQPARGVAYRESDTLVSYRPSENETYADTFTYQLCEEDGSEEVTGTITVNVTKHTLAPVATDDEYAAEGNQTLALEVLANDSDADSTFDVCTEDGYTRPAHGTLALEDQVFVYTPETDYVGEDEFTYTLCDPDGNQATARVSLTLLEPTPDLPPTLRSQKLQAYPGNEVTFASLGELTSDEEVDSVTYTLSEIDEKLDCTPTAELTAQTEITCTPALDIAPNFTYTFEVTPQDASGQQGEAAQFELEILPLLNPTIELEAEIPDPRAPLTGQAVTLKLRVQNPNAVPVRNVRTSLYVSPEYASFQEGDQSRFTLPWNLLASAAPATEENTLTQEFTLDTLEALGTETYETVIILKQNSFGPIRAETAITGLGVDNETATLEGYSNVFEENTANQTPSTPERATPPGVTSTPRTGGSGGNLILLGLVSVVGAGLFWLARRNRRLREEAQKLDLS